MAGDIDPRTFRTAAGQFMTGVTIVTTSGPDGVPQGLTANSFTSISLDPPMVAFSLGRTSDTFLAFDAGVGFVVHILAATQLDLAIRFASKGIDRFEGVAVHPGWNGLPVLAGTLAVFGCRLLHRSEGGDHLIFVGEVEALTVGDQTVPALGYFRGRYVSSESLDQA